MTRLGGASMRALTAVFLLGLIGMVHAGSFDSTFVKALGAKTFKKQVMGTNRATIACFYAPWCGHCQRLAPEYEKAAKNLAGMVDFVSINCDEDANKSLCGQYGVQGFPTIKVFGGAVKSQTQDYMGERTASALVKEGTRAMPSFSKRIKTESELLALVSKPPKKPVVILLTDKITPSSLYKALSAEHNKDFTFHHIKDGPEFDALKAAYGLNKTPALGIWKGGQHVEIYDGTLKIGHITHWLKQVTKDSTKDEL